MKEIKVGGRLYSNNSAPLKGFDFSGISDITWHISNLTCTEDILKFSGLEKFIFTRKDIISIDVYKRSFLSPKGIKINHKVDNYYNFILFCPFIGTEPEDLLHKIKSTGFLDKDISLIDPKLIEEVKKEQNKPRAYDEVLSGLYIAMIIVCIFLVVFIIYRLFFS